MPESDSTFNPTAAAVATVLFEVIQEFCDEQWEDLLIEWASNNDVEVEHFDHDSLEGLAEAYGKTLLDPAGRIVGIVQVAAAEGW